MGINKIQITVDLDDLREKINELEERHTEAYDRGYNDSFYGKEREEALVERYEEGREDGAKDAVSELSDELRDEVGRLKVECSKAYRRGYTAGKKAGVK